jgi:ketosteroid isomerase-like protein
LDVHPNFTRTDAVWDQINAGDYSHALDDIREDVVVDNGPGAGPWRHIEGRDAYVEMMMAFIPLFGESWHQTGRCVYADDQVTIALVHETGTLDGDGFDNLAIWVSRLDAEGKVERQWTVDLAHEALEAFWERHPIET